MKWSGIKKGQYRKRAHDDKNSRYEKVSAEIVICYFIPVADICWSKFRLPTARSMKECYPD